MSDNVIRHPDWHKPLDHSEPDEEIIECLERLLARAKAGEIQAFGAAYVEPGGVPVSAYSCSDDYVFFNLLTTAIQMLDMRQRSFYVERPIPLDKDDEDEPA